MSRLGCCRHCSKRRCEFDGTYVSRHTGRKGLVEWEHGCCPRCDVAATIAAARARATPATLGVVWGPWCDGMADAAKIARKSR